MEMQRNAQERTEAILAKNLLNGFADEYRRVVMSACADPKCSSLRAFVKSNVDSYNEQMLQASARARAVTLRVDGTSNPAIAHVESDRGAGRS